MPNTSRNSGATIQKSECIVRSLIKFDLSSIPANATITSATLSLWTTGDLSDNDRTIRVYRLKTAFDESSATWNESASGVSWQSAGASGTNALQFLYVNRLRQYKTQ